MKKKINLKKVTRDNRISIYISKGTHKLLKILAVKEEVPLATLTDDIIELYVNQKSVAKRISA